MGERENIAHLLRRASFGPTAEEVDAAEQAGYLATVSRLTGAPGPPLGPKMPALPQDPAFALRNMGTQAQKDAAFKARRDQQELITDWWLDRMVANGHEMEEKLTFFWHGHWATSLEKVFSAPQMLLQHSTFRIHGRGSFASLAKAMIRDPALIIWLDGQRNTRTAPNENLARELMELFILGIGNYSEADVKAGARALTGWTVDRVTATTAFDPARFDAGEKTVLKQTGNFNADSLVDLLVRQPASANFLASRFWFRFASADPAPPHAISRIAAAYTSQYNIADLLRAMFEEPAFQQTKGQLVKQPVEWLVGAMRQLRLRPSQFNLADRRRLATYLEGLDQVLFRPPSVGGWPSGLAWLTSQSARIKLQIAHMLIGKVTKATLSSIAEVPANGRSRALARTLVVDAWSDRTNTVLDRLSGDPRKMLAACLVSPEYWVH